eukprot:11241298-Alexandrium_andersonii.AAC.1
MDRTPALHKACLMPGALPNRSPMGPPPHCVMGRAPHCVMGASALHNGCLLACLLYTSPSPRD